MKTELEVTSRCGHHKEVSVTNAAGFGLGVTALAAVLVLLVAAPTGWAATKGAAQRVNDGADQVQGALRAAKLGMPGNPQPPPGNPQLPPNPGAVTCGPPPPPCDRCTPSQQMAMAPMAIWSVSQPFINLWIQDTPIGYEPPRGPNMAFMAAWRQRETNPINTAFFNLGTNWNCSWRSWVREESATTATLFAPSGGAIFFTNTGVWIDYASGARLERLTNAGSLSGYRLTHQDGAKDTFDYAAPGSPKIFFVTTNETAQGFRVTYNYATSGSAVRLLAVVDASTQTNTLSYVSNVWSGNLISAVTDPFGRSASFAYDTSGRLTNITDPIGITSSFRYSTSGDITNLITPYGTTGFELSGGDIALDTGGTCAPRLAKVTQPNGAKELFAFFNHLPTIPASVGSPGFPSGCSSNLNEICDGAQQYCVSFHWGPRQYEALSSAAKADICDGTAEDFMLGTLTRWLRCGDTNILGTTPAMICLPSPTSTSPTTGQTYWFGYTNSEGLVEQSSPNPSMLAYRSTGSSEYLNRPVYNSARSTVKTTNSYTKADGSDGTRVQGYAYAANGLDLVRSTNASGVVDAEYAYNGNRQVTSATDGVGDVTLYTYNASGDLVLIVSPTGLITSNYVNSAGYVLQKVVQQINQTNTYTYANGLVQTHTDPRGLALTYQYDALQRAVSVSYPDGTYTSNRHQYLDLTGTRDRSGNWTYVGYNEMRWKTSQTNALAEVERWNYCTCGALDSYVDVLGRTTSYYYNNQDRRIAVIYPDNSWTSNYFNALGQLTNTVNSCGLGTTNTFNLQGLKVGATNNLQAEASRLFDVEDHLVQTAGANGVTMTISYDNQGRVIESSAPGGFLEQMTYTKGLMTTSSTACATNTYGYDLAGRRIAETNAVGYVTRWTYNAAGDVTSLISPTGLTTTNTYDSEGQLTRSVALEISRTNSAAYAVGRLTTQTDARGLTTTFEYDALNRVIATQFPDGTLRSNRFNGPNLVATRNRLGAWRYTGYDSMNRRVAETNEVGSVTLFGYTCGRLSSVTNAVGDVTSYLTDALGRTVKVTQPDGSWVASSFNTLSQLVTNQTSAGQITTSFFDSAGRLHRVDNAIGTILLHYFDTCGRVTNTVDANGVSVILTLDALGRSIARTYPDGGIERIAYSSAGVTIQSNQIGYTTRFAYDAAGRQVAETNANGEVVQFSYSAAEDRLSLIDGKNQTTTWKYDLYGLVTNKTDAAGSTMFTYRYDAEGRLTNRWTPAKGTTAYTYDAAGQLTKTDYPTSTDITLTLDALGRVTNMVDAAGTSRYTYHSSGQVLTEDGPFESDTVSYSYTNGLLAGVTVQGAPGFSAWTTSYGWDAAGRFQTVASPAGTFTYNYSGANLLPRKLALPGGNIITNDYDSVARMRFTKFYAPSSALLNSHTYIYNLAGQVTNQTRTYGDYVDYGYDASGQLSLAVGKESGGASRVHEQFGYAYDAAGNLSYRTNNALIQPFNVNNLNELTTAGRSGTLTVAGATQPTATGVTVNGSAATRYTDNSFAKSGVSLVDGTNIFTAVAQDSLGRSDTTTATAWLPATNAFTYDANGNLTYDGQQYYEWDDENQLTRVGVTNAWKSEFTYDAQRRRQTQHEFTWQNASWVTTNLTIYCWQGKVVLQERHSRAGRFSSTNAQRSVTYTRGPDLSVSIDGAGGTAGLLARSEQSTTTATPTVVQYHGDRLGNITLLAFANGVIAARYTYDPYGRELASLGPLASANTYRFSSQEAHHHSGLVAYLYRFYSPTLQRWLSRDPIEEDGGANLYVIVHNDLANRLDILGHADWVGPPAPLAPIDPKDMWVGPPAPLPPIDPSKDTRLYNCAGVAFRDYTMKPKEDTIAKLKRDCTASDTSTRCPCGQRKCVFYDITALKITDLKGKVFRNGAIKGEFHIACGNEDGHDCIQKNGACDLTKPGHITDHPPGVPCPPQPAYIYTPTYTTTFYCCNP